MAGMFTFVGWQVTLCDPIRQVTLHSSVMCFPLRAILRFNLLTFTIHASFITNTKKEPESAYFDLTVKPVYCDTVMKMNNTTVTWMSTPGWLSEYVVNVCVCLVGIVVLRLIREVITPPAVSIPRDSGATSSSSRSCTASDLSPCKIAACTAAINTTIHFPFITVHITSQFLHK